VIPFRNSSDAIAKATELETSGSSLNAVYVRASNPKQLRSAYRNYFNDPIDFVKIIQEEAKVEMSAMQDLPELAYGRVVNCSVGNVRFLRVADRQAVWFTKDRLQRHRTF
jgi:hypothetical protein